MASVYTVSQISQYIKNMFTQDYMLKSVSILGEISNLKYHSSGHIYFSVKEGDAVLDGIMFKSSAASLKFRLKDGMRVIITGSIETYKGNSKYQIYARTITLDGQGELYQKYEQLKIKLEEMGMFDDMYKTPIPKYATRIGIVTSKTGAAIQDIINVSKRRNPYVNLFLYPALVQGEGAFLSIINGIKVLDDFGVDIIIIGRGGGSIEDLWAFNEEEVAKAIFECNTPIISAVGHQTDYTIADFVSDLRAPTPSAAAEIAVFEYDKFLDDLDNYENILKKHIYKKIEIYRNKTLSYERIVKSKSPRSIINFKKHKLAEYENNLKQCINNTIVQKKNRLGIIATKLEGKSPLYKIGNGYAYIAKEDNKKIKSIKDIKLGDEINISLRDGILKGNVTDIKERENYGK